MATPTNICGDDPVTKNVLKATVEHKTGHNGLVVWTDKLHHGITAIRPFLSSTYGASLNQNVTVGGTPEIIHSGVADSVAWTGSNVTGTKVAFNSTVRIITGTQSIQVDNPTLLDTWQFLRASTTALTGFETLTFNVNVDSAWTLGDVVSMFAWDSASALQVGDAVNINDYFDPFNFDVDQSVSIPIEDFNVGTDSIDAFRMTLTEKDGQAPTFYLDDITLQQTGAPASFFLRPDSGFIYTVDRIFLTFADDINISVTNGTAAGLSHDQIMGIASLPFGLILRRIVDGLIVQTSIIRNIGDLMAVGGTVSDVVCDGTDTLVTMALDFTALDLVLTSSTLDHMEVIVNDNLSPLTRFNIVSLGTLIKEQEDQD